MVENNTFKFKQQNAHFFDDVEPAKWKSKLENVSKNKVLSKAKTKQPESKLKVNAKDSKLVSSYGIFAFENSWAICTLLTIKTIPEFSPDSEEVFYISLLQIIYDSFNFQGNDCTDSCFPDARKRFNYLILTSKFYHKFIATVC